MLETPEIALIKNTHSCKTRLSELRNLIRSHGLDAYWIPSQDEHLSEYVPEDKKRRALMSGFDGSAGDLLVTLQDAWLFVDSRYHEQAEQDVAGMEIRVSKLGVEGHLSLLEQLKLYATQKNRQHEAAAEKPASFRVGLDPFTITLSTYRDFLKQLKHSHLTVSPISENLVDRVLHQQKLASGQEPASIPPENPLSSVYLLPETISGMLPIEKLQKLREAMHQQNAQWLPITKLDQIAWLFNLRGQDIPYNPVFTAYALVSPEKAWLFTDLQKLSPELRSAMSGWVNCCPYEDFFKALSVLGQKSTEHAVVLIDPASTTWGTYQELGNGMDSNFGSVSIVENKNPIELLKACKNTTEQARMKMANFSASRAKIRLLKWLSDTLKTEKAISELDISNAMASFYQQEADFKGLSFNTIASIGANASIVHYGTPSSEIFTRSGQFLLLDSGAHYLGGTTDDTRTVIIGEPDEKQIYLYTQVLKAHINAAAQKFPKGTTGVQIDALARAPMWQCGLDYGHGTGHGVGAFLNVHEGPNGIHKRAYEPLQPGMVNSIEPGYYEPGWGGIRLENLYLVKTVEETTPGTDAALPRYYFEPLTWIPFDLNLVQLEALTEDQLQWLKEYHHQVLERMLPHLSPEEGLWLQQYCAV